MDYKIAIPSLGRSKILQEQTFATLMRNNINPQRITVFVVEEEYDEYRKAVPDIISVVVGVRGIVQQRKFINNHYPEGTCVVSIDDDIKDIDLSLSQFQDLNSFFMCAFDDLYEHDAYLWGIYPVFNQFFRKQRQHMTSNLEFIIGGIYGARVRHDEDLETTVAISGKEDLERTLRYWIKDGCILRYNRIGYQTKFFGNDGGGLGSMKKRKAGDNMECRLIDDKFGMYGKIKERKDGRLEFVLHKIPRRLKTDVVTKLERIDPPCFDPLYQMLMKITIPQIISKEHKHGTARRGFGTHRAVCIGMVRRRMTAEIGLSAFSKKYPKISEEIFRIGKIICPFDFTSVHLNNNVVCPPHVDSKNTGVSCIVSFGEYEGGKLVVDGVEYDAWCQPLTFNGSSLIHYNTPLEEGSNKYSLVFYNHGQCSDVKEEE